MTKKFKKWGIRRRLYPENNYNALWVGETLETFRFGEGHALQLEPECSEFYDIGINTLCNAECPFCYVSASHKGKNFDNICETWKSWMSQYEDKYGLDENDAKAKEMIRLNDELKNVPVTYTTKPFQIAIGSSGEPTVHPDFCDFIKTVYDTNVVPNYTTNGITISNDDELSKKILEYTDKYVGGVAVSFGNKALRKYARKAINKLKDVDTNINIHHIIYSEEDVDEFVDVAEEYNNVIKYHVLLPMMASGRSTQSMTEEVFLYLIDKIVENNIKNVAFGAHFIKFLNKQNKIKCYTYPPESFSKNVILDNHKVVITPSSFDLMTYLKEIYVK